MKSIDKYVTALKNPAEEAAKRYKALTSLKKTCKEHEDMPTYIQVINEYHNNIFFSITEKMAKMPTSTFEKVLTMTSSSQQLGEYLDYMQDLFFLLERPSLKELLFKNRIRIIAILYKLLDVTTKKEYRRMSFQFLLRILDSFEDPIDADKEYICLFNYALDHPALREGSSKPAYILQITGNNMNTTSNNDVLHHVNSFGEMSRVITENANAARSEEAVKDIFECFTKYLKSHRGTKNNRARVWYHFFNNTWKDIFFNSQGVEKVNSVAFFTETKKKAMTFNSSMLKHFVYLFETILKDKIFMLSKDDLFLIMDSMKYLYWDTRLKVEVNKVLKIFYDFVAKNIDFYTEDDFEDAIRVKLISTLDENCYNYFFQEFMNINLNSQDKEEYEVIPPQPQENLCLSIFNELIRLYDNKYAKEIFKTVEFALQKASTQIGNPSKDYLYPLIETVLLIAIRAEPSDRPEFEATVRQYMEYKEIAAKVNDFMIKRTEAFICSYYNDSKYELLQYMELHSGKKSYEMKIEYLIQYLLQQFCQENTVKNSKEHCYFENEMNTDRVLQVKVNEDLFKDKELVQVLENLQVKFNQWIACLILLYNLEFSKSKNMFPNISRGISDIIQKLIEPDSIQLPTTGDRVKVSPKPRYPVPTETLYQIFGHYFTLSLSMQEKPKYEGRLWATKAYLRIFCNTQSEILPTKSIIIELISFINSAVKSFTLKDDDLELFMTICVVLKNSEQIFLTDYPGIKILIPSYLKLIEYMLTTERFNQLDQSSRAILDKVLLDTDTGKIELQSQSSTFVVKNAALNVLKSILFMGYALPDMKIVNIPEGKTSKAGSPETGNTMEMIREKAFLITYKALERLKNLKPRGTKVAASNESSDIEIQFNLLTLSTIIVYLECHPTTSHKVRFGNISIEDFIDLYLQQFCFDLNAMHQEHLSLHIQAVGTLASIISSDMKHYTKIYRQIISTLTSTLASIPQKQPSPQKKELAADLFFALLKWLLSDKTGVLIKEEITLHGLIRMMTTFSSQPEYRDVFEMFFNNIFVNYMNFPFKNQDRDNTRSIFDETSFKDLPTKYLECLNPQRLEEFDGPRERFRADYSNLKEAAKSETTDTQTSISKLDDTQSLDIHDNDYELDIQDSNESKRKRDRLISLFDYLPFNKDDLKRLLQTMSIRERDIIDYLNSQINSLSSETQHSDVRYLTFRDNTFISAASSSSRTTGGRVLFRNMTGKFAWEFSYLQALDQKALERHPKTFDDINKKTLTVKCLNLFQEKENVQERPSATDALNLQLRGDLDQEVQTQRDVFKELYDYIKQHVTDFVEFNLETLSEVKRDLSLSNSDQFEIKYDKAKDLEEKITKRYKREVDTEHRRRQDVREMNQNKKMFQLDENILKLSNFDGIRMLFSHLGYLSLFKSMELGVFENNKANSNLQTTVNLLDIAPARETIKIGVIYAAKGQDNQKEILKNTSGSKSYEDFISNLGQKVSLKHHLGFQAGLKHKADGDLAVYHSDALTELMFHVATMMPTEAEDDQVLNKKKHVGNDFVNIIWCENYRGYRVNTITTQFNFVQIVIYPIKFNLYKIVVFKKSNVGMINYLFPWIDNMIISKEHLPLLVKLCSIHGFRKSRAAKDSPFKSYQKRTDYLRQFNTPESAGSTTQFKKKTESFDIVSSLLLS